MITELKKRAWILPITALYFFFFQIILWEFGLFGSAGYARYFVCISPVMALLALSAINQIELRVQPTISIGHPEVNAATAALSSDLPTALIQDDAFRIQLDPEFIDLKCCLWGVDDFQSNQCLESFINGFLPQLLGSFFGISIEN